MGKSKRGKLSATIDLEIYERFITHCKKEDKDYSKATATAIKEYLSKREGDKE